MHSKAGEQMAKALVVGAGFVGLSCAWWLQENGYEVEVLERRSVGAGASFGNAGWLSPALALPLNDPSVVAYALKSLADPNAPLRVYPEPNLQLARFTLQFLYNCIPEHWRQAASALATLDAAALVAFDEMGLSGVTIKAPIVAGFENREQARGLLSEFDHIRRIGLPLSYRELESPGTPFGEKVGYAIAIEDQRYIVPFPALELLAASVQERGGSIIQSGSVVDIERCNSSIEAITIGGERYRADVAVVSNGAWLGSLSRRLGIKVAVMAGRGYSMDVPCSPAPASPIYFPVQRVACTPIGGGRMRIAGTMEIRNVSDPPDERRFEAITRSVEHLLPGADLSDAANHWVGPRPVSADGIPLIGESAIKDVYIAGGHGMWGVTLGPITGKLLAERMASGSSSIDLFPFDPLRSPFWRSLHKCQSRRND
jgi:D-amino-acid dehydrogenase